MIRNILLTSPDILEIERPLRYYSVRSESGRSYCEAMQGMEAGTRYILSRFPIDEIVVLDEKDLSDPAKSEEPVRLRDAGALYGADPLTLSAYGLYRSRIAQFADGLSLDQMDYNALLSSDLRARVVDFISDFLKRQKKELNSLFDDLASDQKVNEQFMTELFAAVPETRQESILTILWVKNYLYTQLKPSARFEILPENENCRVRFVPSDTLEDREYWVSDVLDIDPSALNDEGEINLYVALGNSPAVAEHLVLNMLSILTAAPGNGIHLKKSWKIYGPAGSMTGVIEDYTAVSCSSYLSSAAHAFLNYGKTDMLIDFWENSGEKNDRISRLVYAARHVDVGISMCNLLEVQAGIRQMRDLFTDERSWTEEGDYGLLFGVIAGCIATDYGQLLEDDGTISFLRLIKWAYRHQLFQQVLTLIESHAPTHLVSAGIFYYCDDAKHMPEVVNLLARQRLELKPYEYYKMDDLDHYFIKSYDRSGVRIARGEDRSLAYATLRAQSIGNRDPGKITGYTACDSTETVKNILYTYTQLGTVRNKLSHSDFSALARENMIVSDDHTSYAMKLMMESIDAFIMSYEKALEEVRGKNPKVIRARIDDVRQAAEAMMGPKAREEQRRPAERSS